MIPWLRLAPYIAAATLAATVWGVFVWRGHEIDRLRDENARLSASLAACGARWSALIRDKERDDEIDNLSDDDLRNVPPGWLLSPAAP